MRKPLLVFAPLLIILLSAVVALVLVKLRPEIETQTPVALPPLVRTLTATPEDVSVLVESQGTVEPRTATVLVAEVAGRVVAVSPSFAVGGAFENGSVLLQIDPVDHELAVVQARSQVAQAELRLAQEEAEATIAREEWGALEEGEAPPLASRDLQVAQARTAFEAAKAAQKQAERNLERTRVRAPYPGRVRRTLVDIGQFVSPGTPVGEIFATDYTEVRLPVRDSELAFLDVPLDGRSDLGGPRVVLRGEFAGRARTWEGRIVRAEGEIDPRTRMVHLIARVESPDDAPEAPLGTPEAPLGTPEAPLGTPEAPLRTPEAPLRTPEAPLSVGLFVTAEIFGESLEDVFVIPRSALRPGNELLIVDAEDRLRFRTVEVVRVERDTVFLTGGVVAGERICLSNLQVVSNGMKVRTSGSVS